jgi:SSS family solute:Na+ symporter/sodium/pantothenate symporter
MADLLPFGPGAWVFISCYLCSLLVVGWFGFNARQEDTLQDFYLGGRGFGFAILFLTLYATQYSGNSVFGVTGAAYRLGFGWLIAVHYMLAIIVCYLAYAPKLHSLSRLRGYVTPVDYLKDRFNSPAIAIVASLVMIVALNNYLLAQLMTMGRALQGLAGAYGDAAYDYGVIGLALIMLIYGTLGGVRAIAWTDVIQGGVLMVGFLVLLLLLREQFGPLSAATNTVASSIDIDKIARPSAGMLREWLSYIVLIGLGASLYPQAIQRVYAARSRRVLNQSLAVMAFLPFGTALIAVIAGIYALAYIPGLEGAATDQVLARLLRVVQDSSLFGYAFVVLIFSAILAALMSTADSAMLSISSMFTKDIYGTHLRPTATEQDLTRIGKRCSWLVVCALAALAIVLKDHASLIALIDRGIHWSGLKSGPTLWGLIAGLSIALALAFGPFDFVVSGKLWGFHPGLYGLVANVAISVLGSVGIERNFLFRPIA